MSDEKRPQLSSWLCPNPRCTQSAPLLSKRVLDANAIVVGGSQNWPEPGVKHLCSPINSPITGVSFPTRARQKPSEAELRHRSGASFSVDCRFHIRLFSSQYYSQGDHSLWWSHPTPGSPRSYNQGHPLKSPLEARFKAPLLMASVSSCKLFSPLNPSTFICKVGIIIV